MSKIPTVFASKRTINQIVSFFLAAFQSAIPFQGIVHMVNNAIIQTFCKSDDEEKRNDCIYFCFFYL